MELKKDEWSKITISDYMRIQEIVKTSDVIDMEIELISLLCDVEEEDVLALPIVDYQRLRAKVQFISSFPEIKSTCPKSLMINGRKYDTVRDMRKLITAQYIDFQTYFKMYRADDGERYLPNLLACFIVPEGKVYGEYDVDKVVEDIKEYLPVVAAFEMCGFFQKTFLSSIRAILFYLGRKVKRMKIDRKERKEIMKRLKEVDLMISGDGFTL